MTSQTPLGQRVLFHTHAANPSATLNAPRLLPASAHTTPPPAQNMSASLSKIGRGTKWSLISATAIAISTAAAVQFRDDRQQASLRASKKKELAETDQRYQSLLDAYGSGESLEDLQKAVGSYEAGSERRGR